MTWETVAIDLQGLDQKTDPKHKVPGALKTATNVEMDKRGCLNKRPGYATVTVTTEALGGTPEEVFSGLAVCFGELLVFGYDKLYAVGSHDGSLPGSRCLVERCVVPRGNVKQMDVVSSVASDESPPE